MSIVTDAKALARQIDRPPTDNEAREIGRGRILAREVVNAIRAEKLPADTMFGAIHYARQEGGDTLIGFFREIQDALGQR